MDVLRNAIIAVVLKHEGSSTEIINVMTRLLAEMLALAPPEYRAIALKEIPLIVRTYLQEIDAERVRA